MVFGTDYFYGSVGGQDLDGGKDGTVPLHIPWGVGDPYGVVVDPIERTLYYSDVFGLMSFDLDYDTNSEEGPEVVYPLEDMKGYRDLGLRTGIFDLEMDYKRGVIYWSAADGIGKSRLADGREGISLFMEVPARQIAVDSEREDLYWAKNDEIFRTTLEGSSSQLVVDVSGFQDEMTEDAISNIVDMAVYNGRIYWSDLAGTLHSCDRDGKDLRTLFAPVVRSPSGIFADTERGMILWGDRLSGSVYEASLDGSGMRIITSGFLDVSDVLATGDRLYWTDNATGEIWSSDLDGSEAEPVIQLAESLPTSLRQPPMSIAYDSVGDRVCWQGQHIYCADHDGSSVDLLVDGEGSTLYDIAVDGPQGFLYWTDREGLWRMKSDGGERESLYRRRDFGVGHRPPIALSLDRVYWTTWEYRSMWPDWWEWVDLHRLDKDDTDAQSIYFEHFVYERNEEHPESIAFYLPARTAVHHHSEPSQSDLHSNYPNPFNGETRIPYTVSRDGPVSLTIYNALGQPVASLANGMHSRGAYEAVWDTEGPESLASGVYLARLMAGDVVKMRKLTLLR